MAQAKPLEYGLSENLIVKLSPKPKKKIFVICPVRPPKTGPLKKIFRKITNLLFGTANQWTKKQDAIRAYVAKLEAEGNEVYWPARDNPYQKTDKIGIKICEHNRGKMFWADEIHIWYDKNSIGSIFDIGMFFAFVGNKYFKKFIIINGKDVARTPHKSFENVVLTLAKKFDNPVADGLKERWDNHGK